MVSDTGFVDISSWCEALLGPCTTSKRVPWLPRMGIASRTHIVVDDVFLDISRPAIVVSLLFDG